MFRIIPSYLMFNTMYVCKYVIFSIPKYIKNRKMYISSLVSLNCQVFELSSLCQTKLMFSLLFIELKIRAPDKPIVRLP